MFRILDGRTHFYQWDTNQQLEVLDTSITEVHFSTMVLVKALVCEVREENGKRIVDVPNILLQGTWDLKVYGTCDCYTHAATIFEVKAKEKPENYVYTETEVKRYDDLEERIAALENGGGTGGGGSIEIDLSDYYTKAEVDSSIHAIQQGMNDSFGALSTSLLLHKEESDAAFAAIDSKGYQTEAQVNALITNALGVIEDGTY